MTKNEMENSAANGDAMSEPLTANNNTEQQAQDNILTQAFANATQFDQATESTDRTDAAENVPREAAIQSIEQPQTATHDANPQPIDNAIASAAGADAAASNAKDGLYKASGSGVVRETFTKEEYERSKRAEQIAEDDAKPATSKRKHQRARTPDDDDEDSEPPARKAKTSRSRSKKVKAEPADGDTGDAKPLGKRGVQPLPEYEEDKQKDRDQQDVEYISLPEGNRLIKGGDAITLELRLKFTSYSADAPIVPKVAHAKAGFEVIYAQVHKGSTKKAAAKVERGPPIKETRPSTQTVYDDRAIVEVLKNANDPEVDWITSGHLRKYKHNFDNNDHVKQHTCAGDAAFVEIDVPVSGAGDANPGMGEGTVKTKKERYYLCYGGVFALWGKDGGTLTQGKTKKYYLDPTHASYVSARTIKTDADHDYRTPLMLVQYPRPPQTGGEPLTGLPVSLFQPYGEQKAGRKSKSSYGDAKATPPASTNRKTKHAVKTESKESGFDLSGFGLDGYVKSEDGEDEDEKGESMA